MKKAPSYFHEKVFDLAALDIKDKKGGKSGENGLVSFINEKINIGLHNFSTTSKFVNEGYQEAFAAMMGMNSMAQDLLNNYDGFASKMTQPMLFSYLAYASERLVEEGVALDEDDAADGEFKRAFRQIDADLAKKIDTEGLYNADFKKMLHGKFESMNSHVTEIRELLMELLFTHNGPLLGWQHEEESDFIVVDASEEDAMPVYRLYNPYSSNGEHDWTTSIAERDMLVGLGWSDEGVC